MVPLYVRVTVDGKRAEISLKKKLSLKKWDARSGFMKGSGDEVRITNRYINEVMTYSKYMLRSTGMAAR